MPSPADARSIIESWIGSPQPLEQNGPRICRLVDGLDLPDLPEVWPIIVAAGKGSRARASGLQVAKSVAPVLGVPAASRVLQTVRAACGKTRRPIVLISPESEAEIRGALLHEEVTYVLQPRALGTGDAVLHAHEAMTGYKGRVLIVWGTQPVIRPVTIVRLLKLAALFQDYSLILPTAWVARPYAFIVRQNDGSVKKAQESHLEGAEPPAAGETNIGLFLVSATAVFDLLHGLRARLWHEEEQKYARPSGELGFPNEVIGALAEHRGGVLALPIADWREQQGIKSRADVSDCERYIQELAATASEGQPAEHDPTLRQQ